MKSCEKKWARRGWEEELGEEKGEERSVLTGREQVEKPLPETKNHGSAKR